MFNQRTQFVDERLDTAIDTQIEAMQGIDQSTETYAKMNENLVKLLTLKQNTMPKRMSRDTVLLVAANLTGIVAILAAENTRVVASKALGLVLKAR